VRVTIRRYLDSRILASSTSERQLSSHYANTVLAEHRLYARPEPSPQFPCDNNGECQLAATELVTFLACVEIGRYMDPLQPSTVSARNRQKGCFMSSFAGALTLHISSGVP
jgi:hypothetical protein